MTLEYGHYDASHDVFTAVPPLTKLWRYMDFTKFVALLEYRALTFARADTLGDPFEGSSTALTAIGDDGNGGFNWVRSSIEQTFVSCWNQSDVESDALWNRYTDAEAGVAIQTTFGQLAASFEHGGPSEPNDRQPVYLGKVAYVDYATAVWPRNNAFWPFVHKRLSFAHENEVRAVALWPGMDWMLSERAALRALRSEIGEEEWHARSMTRGGIPGSSPMPPAPAAWRFAVDLDVLIENLYVSPAAPNWFAELVHDVTTRYRLTVEPQQSALAALPVF